MSKNLKAIQILAKIGKIISKVTFIVTVVCGIICLAYLSALLGVQELRVGGTDLIAWLTKGNDMSLEAQYFACVSGVIVCIGQAVLCKFSYRYFKNELSAGTPFTNEGATEILRLGIITLVIPCVIVIAQEVARNVWFPGILEFATEDMTEMGYGVMFILCSVFFRYGAELENGKQLDKGEG
ncbi:MAG: hypothetical protein J6J42_04700 [Lachnospiraceae bacterium]|nr:hypothetical protein [Lachnospiraceae bacterium]